MIAGPPTGGVLLESTHKFRNQGRRRRRRRRSRRRRRRRRRRRSKVYSKQAMSELDAGRDRATPGQ
jgi:hypothetical protein